MDFGFLPFDCRLESAYGYMTMIFGILWNACWSYELMQCVKSPMIYSERNHKYYQGFTYFIGILITIISFGLYSYFIKLEGGLVCTLDDNLFYVLFKAFPIYFTILFNFYV